MKTSASPTSPRRAEEQMGPHTHASHIARLCLDRMMALRAASAKRRGQRVFLSSLSSEDRALLGRNQIFRDRHKGKRCFVIGNGPSLRTQNLLPLANELTFVMNAFWKNPVVEKWQPTYYFFADGLYFDGSEPMRIFFSNLRSVVHASTFFLPIFGKHVVRSMSLLSPDMTYYVAFHGSLSDELSHLPDFTGIVPGVQSVSEFAIMAAMYMGCSPIYLLGLDHDWLSHSGMDRHFYEGATVDHPQAEQNLGKYSYRVLMESQLRLWYGYESILRVANTAGIRIVNATRGGFLDVFEREDYDSLIRD